MTPSKIAFMERRVGVRPFLATQGFVLDALTEGQAFLSEHPKCHDGKRREKEAIFVDLLASAFKARDYDEELRRLAAYLDCEITKADGFTYKFVQKAKQGGADELAVSEWRFNKEWEFVDDV